MNKKRIKYIGLIFTVVLMGLLSRKISIIPLFVGDVLWAIMMYLIVSLIFIKKSIKEVFVISLLICLTVELSQLYRAEWINSIRGTLPGRLVLGQGFLVSDLFAYTFGVSLVAFTHLRITKN